jgi:type IV pilus assembly protein PilA
MSLVERCRQRHHGTEGLDEGFTLIELLVVLLIIGILLAIAIPTFLSVTKGANGTAAQSNLNNALTGAKTYYTDSNQSYIGLLTGSGGTTSSLSQIGTGLIYVSAAGTAGLATGNHTLAVASGPNGNWVELTAWAPGQNDCWIVFDSTSATNVGTVNGFTGVTGAGTWFGVQRSIPTNANCKPGLTPSATSQAAFPSP